MAATRGTVQGYRKNGSFQADKGSRLGNGAVLVTADTWKTFVNAEVNADGSGYIRVMRDGERIHQFAFGPEGGK